MMYIVLCGMLFNQMYNITLLIRRMEYVLFCVGWVGWLVQVEHIWKRKTWTWIFCYTHSVEWFKRASAFKRKTCHNSLSCGLTNNMKKKKMKVIRFHLKTIQFQWTLVSNFSYNAAQATKERQTNIKLVYSNTIFGGRSYGLTYRPAIEYLYISFDSRYIYIMV